MLLSLLLLFGVGALWADTLRNRIERGSRAEWAALGAIAAVALGLRLVGLGDSALEHLEATYLFEAVKPESVWATLTSRQSAEQMHQPLFALILRGWTDMSGTGLDEWWLRLPSALMSVACIPLVWALARPELGKAGGLWAAGLTAASPLLLWYGRDCSPYALLAVTSLIAITSCGQSLNKPSRWAAVRTGLALALAFYSHFHGGWVCVTVGLWLLTERTRRRMFWETTATTALLCLPWIAPMMDKLLQSVHGLTEDAPIMRYSHDPFEATSEAFRMLFGGPSPTWLLTAALICAGTAMLWRQRGRLGRLGPLIVVAAAVGLLAELHILWQLSRAKGITYVDVRHYIYLGPLLLLAVPATAIRWPRAGHVAAALALSLQLWTSVGLLSTGKPDVRSAVEHMRPHLGPDHGIAFLPAPWYQSILEYYLFGVCPDLVHARSHEGWWTLDRCEQSEEPAPNSVYGFPPTPERMASSARRSQLRYLWVLEIRDHRFGLPVAPTTPQERFLCWEGKKRALMETKTFGPWVTLELYDIQALRTLPGPPPAGELPPVRTVTAAEAWQLRCQ